MRRAAPLRAMEAPGQQVQGFRPPSPGHSHHHEMQRRGQQMPRGSEAASAQAGPPQPESQAVQTGWMQIHT